MDSSREHIKALMCEVPQFDQLNAAEIDILSQYIEKENASSGMVLCKEGSMGNSLFYIVKGKIEIKKEATDGRQTVMAQFNKGSTVGEMSLIEDTPRSATATALEDVELLVLTHVNFEKILEINPAIGIKILRNIAKSISTRLRHTSGRFADLFK